jgi:hypothetical protein
MTQDGETVARSSETRSMPRTDLALWLALSVALVMLLQPGTPPRVAVLSLILVAATLAVSLRWRIGPAVIVVLLLVGMALRAVPPNGFSDVLIVTEAAIREMLAGGSPYGVGFETSVPPGAPFAYGPVALLWYLPSLDEPGRLETLASLAILVALAVRGRALGLAIYAVSPALVVAAGDGANDTTAGLLLLISLLVAVRLPVAGAVLLAITTAFKPYALAWLPGLIAYAGAVAPLLAFLVASLALWLPALIAWGPRAVFESFRLADQLHTLPFYSLATAVGERVELSREAWQALRLFAGVLLAALSLVLVRSATSFILMGTLVFVATLYLGWWSTFAYVAAIAPVLCWHLDDWLGLGGQRVVWPGDPVRSVTERVDRWRPVRTPGPHVIDPTWQTG